MDFIDRFETYVGWLDTCQFAEGQIDEPRDEEKEKWIRDIIRGTASPPDHKQEPNRLPGKSKLTHEVSINICGSTKTKVENNNPWRDAKEMKTKESSGKKISFSIDTRYTVPHESNVQ